MRLLLLLLLLAAAAGVAAQGGVLLGASGTAYTLAVAREKAGRGGGWATPLHVGGVRFRLRFAGPVLVDGGLPVHGASPEQLAALDGSVRVRCRGREPFERLADAGSAMAALDERGYALFPVTRAAGSATAATMWMSMFRDLGPPSGGGDAPPLDLHLVVPADGRAPPSPGSCEVELLRGPRSSLTGAAGEPLEDSARVEAETRLVVAHSVVLRAPPALIQSVDGAAPASPEPEKHRRPREDRRAQLFTADPQRRMDEVYSSLVEVRDANASALSRGIEVGWRLHATDRVEPHLSETVLLEARSHLEAGGAAAVASGMMQGILIEGFAAEAIRMATSKTNELFDNHLEPLVTDALGGHAPGAGANAAAFLEEQAALRAWPGGRGEALVREARRRRWRQDEAAFLEEGSGKRGEQGDQYGVLAVGVAEDLIKSTPDIVDQISQAFSSMAAADLHASLTESVEKPLEEEVLRNVAQWVGLAVPQTVDEVVGSAVERTLPSRLTQQIDRAMVETLTRSLTHSLTDTLVTTLTRTPKLERACYQCRYQRKECDKCFSGRDEHIRYLTGHFSNYYASFYSDYYGEMFATGSMSGAAGAGGGGGK